MYSIIKKLNHSLKNLSQYSLALLNYGFLLCCGILGLSLFLGITVEKNTYLFYEIIWLSKQLADNALLILCEVIICAFVIDIYSKQTS